MRVTGFCAVAMILTLRPYVIAIASEESIGPLGIDSASLALNGGDVGIGQVELGRPGSQNFDTAMGAGTLYHISVNPVQVFRRDHSVRDEIVSALEQATERRNRAALEVSLALLGDPAYITRQNLELKSMSVPVAMLRAIERFEGKHGMDLLMTVGLDHSYAAVADEALLTAQRIAGETWIPEGSRFRPTKYADEARAWWEHNRDQFEGGSSEGITPRLVD